MKVVASVELEINDQLKRNDNDYENTNGLETDVDLKAEETGVPVGNTLASVNTDVTCNQSDMMVLHTIMMVIIMLMSILWGVMKLVFIQKKTEMGSIVMFNSLSQDAVYHADFDGEAQDSVEAGHQASVVFFYGDNDDMVNLSDLVMCGSNVVPIMILPIIDRLFIDAKQWTDYRPIPIIDLLTFFLGNNESNILSNHLITSYPL